MNFFSIFYLSWCYEIIAIDIYAKSWSWCAHSINKCCRNIGILQQQSCYCRLHWMFCFKIYRNNTKKFNSDIFTFLWKLSISSVETVSNNSSTIRCAFALHSFFLSNASNNCSWLQYKEKHDIILEIWKQLVSCCIFIPKFCGSILSFYIWWFLSFCWWCWFNIWFIFLRFLHNLYILLSVFTKEKRNCLKLWKIAFNVKES